MTVRGDRLQPRQGIAQALKTVGICAAEAVDGLVWVADDEQALPRRAPVEHEGALHGVDVLEFIHQQVVEAAVTGHVSVEGVEQQVVEVARAQFPQARLIGVDKRLFDARIGAGHAVFHRGDGAQGGAGRVLAQFRQAI